jgi:hypothetical protein
VWIGIAARDWSRAPTLGTQSGFCVSADVCIAQLPLHLGSGRPVASWYPASIPHCPDLCLELWVALQPEIPTTPAAFPNPGFILLSRQDNDSANFFSGNAVQCDRNELTACSHTGSLDGLLSYSLSNRLS